MADPKRENICPIQMMKKDRIPFKVFLSMADCSVLLFLNQENFMLEK